jgi:hypothetical protein
VGSPRSASFFSRAEWQPYSARPTLLGSLAEPEPAIPEERLLPVLPELALVRAVLVQAINDARLPTPYTERIRHLRKESGAKADAIAWFNSDSDCAFSFLWSCDLLGISPAGVLALLNQPVRSTISIAYGDTFAAGPIRRGRSAHTIRDPAVRGRPGRRPCG